MQRIAVATLAVLLFSFPVSASAYWETNFEVMYVSVALLRAAILLIIGMLWFRIMKNASPESRDAERIFSLQESPGQVVEQDTLPQT